MLHEKPQASILLEVDLSVCPESSYYCYYYYPPALAIFRHRSAQYSWVKEQLGWNSTTTILSITPPLSHHCHKPTTRLFSTPPCLPPPPDELLMQHCCKTRTEAIMDFTITLTSSYNWAIREIASSPMLWYNNYRELKAKINIINEFCLLIR